MLVGSLQFFFLPEKSWREIEAGISPPSRGLLSGNAIWVLFGAKFQIDLAGV